jgi:hypothetical protein
MNEGVYKTLNSSIKFKVNEIAPKIFHLQVKSQRDVTSTLLRFQEFYESPKFKGKIFSVDEFITWYRTTRRGKFSYFSDWTGFNFPSSVLDPFKDGSFGDLTAREKSVLKKFSKEKKFYLIGTFKGTSKKTDQGILNHEIAHAMFYLNPKYKKEVLKVLAPLKLAPIFRYLKNQGYHKDVYLDEAHAYLLDLQDLVVSGIQRLQFVEASEKLIKIFHKYYR